MWNLQVTGGLSLAEKDLSEMNNSCLITLIAKIDKRLISIVAGLEFQGRQFESCLNQDYFHFIVDE